ncbi:diiron oxygenase [Thiolapillus sp.]|uniref:diiron oxygenase n=3 Tax=Thiolapillus sp. TaxID=2017437 RepID=UPI0025D3B9E7|nr:diiron oxygenase [Thiolapillus sp.]
MNADADVLSKIKHASEQDRQCRVVPDFSDIDPGLPFVPEVFTQLYHTSAYDLLNPEQKLRYNQLFGLRSNELFMVFEKGVTRQVIHQLKNARQESDPLLADCLEGMLVEESRHHAMFLDFNRRFLPEGYSNKGRCFTRDSRLEMGVLLTRAKRPGLQPLLLWAVLVLEEFSTAYSRKLVSAETKLPGSLEPSYRRLHALHLQDEQRHVQLDSVLIRELMKNGNPLQRGMNAQLFRFFFRQVLNPRHSGPRVIRYLVTEYPELNRHLADMLRAVRKLGMDPGLQNIMNDSGQMPVTHALLAEYPGFRWY